MKNILKKGSKFFLTALVILNSLMNTLPVHAEETTTDENDLDTIVELGNAEDVFPDLMPQSDGISLTDTTGTGSIYAIIHIANQYGFDYVQQLYVGDKQYSVLSLCSFLQKAWIIMKIPQNGMNYLNKRVRISGKSIIMDMVILDIKQKNTMSQLRL